MLVQAVVCQDFCFIQLFYGKLQAPLTVVLPLGLSDDNIPEMYLKVHKDPAYKADS